MDLDFILRSVPILAVGAEVTLELTLLALAGSIIGGAVVAIARMSRMPSLRGGAIGFIEIMRNTPIMVQIFVFYFGLPSFGLYPSAFASAGIALSLQNSAYIGEIFRAGIQSVHRRQSEAALALGMMPRLVLMRIVGPQAIRRVVPALSNQFIVILKDTSIASTIAVSELTQTGKLLLDRSAAPYETFLVIGLFYLAMTSLILLLLKWAETRFPVRL